MFTKQELMLIKNAIDKVQIVGLSTMEIAISIKNKIEEELKKDGE